MPAPRQVAVYLDRWPAAPVTAFGLAIYCPPDAHPARLDWRYLAALSVLVVAWPGIGRKELVCPRLHNPLDARPMPGRYSACR